MKIFLLLSFLFSSFVFATQLHLTSNEKLWLQKHPQIIVGNENDWAPFDFTVKGVAQGYSVELMKLLAKELGIRVRFVNEYSWPELLHKMDRREIDALCAITKTSSRVEKYNYSLSYLPWRLAYFTQKHRQAENTPLQLDRKKLGVGSGWSSTKMLKQQYPHTEFIEYNTSVEMLQSLAQGRVDLIVESPFVVDYLCNEHLITNIQKLDDVTFETYGEGHLFFASRKNAPELASALSKAYRALSMQVKLDLQQKWFAKTQHAVHFTPEEKEYLKTKKIITMCIDPDWMPFESFDKYGHYIGMTADYFKIFQKDIKVPIEVVKTKTWTESIAYAKARKCDIFSLAMATPERKKYMNFTSPYLSIPLVLATRMDVPFMDNIQLLSQKKIGIVKGYAFNEIVRKRYPNIIVVDVENIHDGLQKVVNGELFGFIGTIASIGYALQRDFVGELKIAGKFPERWNLGIGVRNDEALLLNIFEKEIATLSANAQQKILNKYIQVNYNKQLDYTLLIKVLAGVFLLGLFGIYHYRKLSKMNKELATLKDALQEQVYHDPMTNLYNRRYFYLVSAKLLQLAQRENQELSIMMIDIDLFKKINDTYGHAAGDVVIQKLASLMLQHTRQSDVVTRMGGEEFAILLPNTDVEGAKKMAIKLKTLVEQESLQTNKQQTITFTISIGIAKFEPNETTIDAALGRADKALYRAKESGRNRVEVDR